MGQAHSLRSKGGTVVLPRIEGCDSEQAEGDWVVLEKCSCGEVSDKRKSHEMVQLKGVESGIPCAGASEPCEFNTPRSLVPFEYNLTAVVAVPENSGMIDGPNELESGNRTDMEEVAFKTVRLCYTGVRAASPLLPLVVAGVVGELERGLGMGSG